MNPVEFIIPKLGQTVEEVTIVSWLVDDGAPIEQGQAVLEVETDKAVFPVEANASGILHRGPYRVGDIVPVTTPVAVIGGADDLFGAMAERAEAPAPAEISVSEHAAQERVFVSPRARRLAEERKVDLRRIQPSGGGGVRIVERDVQAFLNRLPKASPLAQRVASDTGISLDSLAGTGPGGRIMRTDVERVMKEKPAQAQTPPPALPSEIEVLERIPLSGVRAITAERMIRSIQATARVTLVMEVDAGEFVAMRQRIRERTEKEWGFAVSYNDLLAKITASALRRFPYMNARITEDAIEYLKPVNMGLAADTERGLIVPVVRDADQKSLRQFGQELRQLIERARSRKSLPDDLAGGTFTITNLGAAGVDAFTPIINLPEAAILGVGRIIEKVVPRSGQIVIRPMMTLSLAFDHRLVDGAPAARFLSCIRDFIEEPYLLVSALQE